VRRNSAKIMTNGVAARWLGANFWSRTGGPLMATLDGGKPAQCVTLGPFGIKVLRIVGRRPPPGEERDLWP
jgi:hypothetical protein